MRAIQTAQGQAEYTPIGHATNLASRMQTVAATGTIATTEDTRKLCEVYFTFRALGPAKVTGVSEAVNVHEVTGLGALRTRLRASAQRGLEVRGSRGGTRPNEAGAGTGEERTRANRGSGGRGRGRQIAAVLRVQGNAAARMPGA